MRTSERIYQRTDKIINWVDSYLGGSRGIAVIATALAMASVILAFIVRIWFPCSRDLWSYILLPFWVIVPPVWFFFDWTYLRPKQREEREISIHFHDLSRNIWLALIVILAAILGVKGLIGSE